MKVELNLSFSQLLLLIEQLPSTQKKKLVEILTKKDLIPQAPFSKERKLGGLEICMSDDSDEPLNFAEI